MRTVKKNYLRFVLVLTALAILASALASCVQSGGGETSGDDATTAVPEQVLPVSELEKYRFVHAEKLGGDLARAISALHKRYDAAVGTDTEQSDDFYREGVPELAMKELEILVGTTNRPESVEFISSLRTNAYGYALMGKKIVIAGRTEDGTVKAIEEFEKNVLSRYEADKTIENFIMSSEGYTFRAEYDVDSLKIGNADIGEWVIAYPAKHPLGENIAASRLGAAIAETCGFTVGVVKDSELEGKSENIISVGRTAQASEAHAAGLEKAGSSAFIGYDGKNMIVGGGDSVATIAAVEQLVAELRSAMTRDGRNVTLMPDAEKKYDVGDNMLTAMSFNHLVSSKTAERTQRVIDMVLKYLPDTIGFQETSPDWMTSLTGALGSIYGYVGEGRNGGDSGEYNPVFYNKSKFNLKESGTRWMSDTPETVSKFEESTYNRIYTYALLERKSDGRLIMIVNTHLDHKSEPARVKQIKVLLDFIEAKCRDYPVVLSGDFNTTPTSDVYNTVLKSFLSDSANVAMQVKRASTFTNYGKSNKTLDYLFVNTARMSVVSYNVCNEKINGDFPSDHHPVLIKYIIND